MRYIGIVSRVGGNGWKRRVVARNDFVRDPVWSAPRDMQMFTSKWSTMLCSATSRFTFLFPNAFDYKLIIILKSKRKRARMAPDWHRRTFSRWSVRLFGRGNVCGREGSCAVDSYAKDSYAFVLMEGVRCGFRENFRFHIFRPYFQSYSAGENWMPNFVWVSSVADSATLRGHIFSKIFHPLIQVPS